MTDEQKQDYIAKIYLDGHWYIQLGIPFGRHIRPIGLCAFGDNPKDFSEAILELCSFQKEPRKIMLEIGISEKKVANEITPV